MNNPKYAMSINLNVLNHLGLNLYSNVPAVLSEVVANSWDADAENVDININIENEKITITDDGHGMSEEDINEKYLNIGYERRKKEETRTPKYSRPVMGRKGIGKLSLFSIAGGWGKKRGGLCQVAAGPLLCLWCSLWEKYQGARATARTSPNSRLSLRHESPLSVLRKICPAML